MTANTVGSRLDRQAFSGSFWLWWALLTTLGFLLSFVLAFAKGIGIGSLCALRGTLGLGAAAFLGLAIGGLLVGAVMGVVQWLIIRRHIPGAARWIWQTAVGSALAFALAIVIAGAVGQGWFLGGLIGGLIGGGVAGFLQQNVLKEYVPDTKLWLIASPVSWAVALIIMGIAMGAAVGRAPGNPGLVMLALVAIIAVFVQAAITGFALMRSVISPQQSA
ncbi:MAG: hypothetical protein FJZ90_04630 [Chloroflexi bacterium]|nr:hypothetical protein [Chloroflexota bacterium]